MENSKINVDGNRVGRIALSAGETTIKGSELSAFNGGGGPILSDSGIDIEATSLQVEDTDIFAFTSRSSDSDAGSIYLMTTHDMNFDNSRVWSLTYGEGDSGAVIARSGGGLSIENEASISTSTFGSGDGGHVTIFAEHSLSLMSDGAIISGTTGEGNAGSVDVFVDGSLEIVNGGQISSDTSGDRAAGRIDITADTIMIHGNPDAEPLTGITSKALEGSSGQAGELNIQANTIRLNNGSVINASNLEITATESLYLDHSQITTSATESNGGNITLTPEILILDGGFIQGNGNVTISTETLIAS